MSETTGIGMNRRSSGRWQARIWVPKHLRQAMGRQVVSREVTGHDRESARKNAVPWARKVRAEFATLEDNPQHSKRHGVAQFNAIVRRAYDAQEAFNNFDCDTLNRPEDIGKLRAISWDWEQANLALIRYAMKYGESLIRELGGRVYRKSKSHENR